MDGDGALFVLVVLVGVGLTWWLLRTPPPSAVAPAPSSGACGGSTGQVVGGGLAGFAGYFTKGAVKLPPDKVCGGVLVAADTARKGLVSVTSSSAGKAGLTLLSAPNRDINTFQAIKNGDFSGAANDALAAATTPFDAINKFSGNPNDLSCAQLKSALQATYGTSDVNYLSTHPTMPRGSLSGGSISTNDPRVRAARLKGCA